MCDIHSHLALKSEIKEQLDNSISVDMQSNIEQTLDDRLQEFEISLEDPNFNIPENDININRLQTDRG